MPLGHGIIARAGRQQRQLIAAGRLPWAPDLLRNPPALTRSPIRPSAAGGEAAGAKARVRRKIAIPGSRK